MIELKGMHFDRNFYAVVGKYCCNKNVLVNLYKDIELVTRLHIFCTTLFTNNNIKIVIQMHAFQVYLMVGINMFEELPSFLRQTEQHFVPF